MVMTGRIGPMGAPPRALLLRRPRPPVLRGRRGHSPRRADGPCAAAASTSATSATHADTRAHGAVRQPPVDLKRHPPLGPFDPSRSTLLHSHPAARPGLRECPRHRPAPAHPMPRARWICALRLLRAFRSGLMLSGRVKPVEQHSIVGVLGAPVSGRERDAPTRPGTFSPRVRATIAFGRTCSRSTRVLRSNRPETCRTSSITHTRSASSARPHSNS